MTIGQDEDDKAFDAAWYKAARPRYITCPSPGDKKLFVVALAYEVWKAGLKRGEEKRGCCHTPEITQAKPRPFGDDEP
jgi:hypothetical protein